MLAIFERPDICLVLSFSWIVYEFSCKLGLFSFFSNHGNMLFSGEYFNLMRDMWDLRESFFYTSFRMTPENFDRLLAKIQPRIRKQSTLLRQPISAAERLAVTLSRLT